ncbi:hypothetical protein O3G_MSEX007506 [Manduca sexta]|uniref:UCH catalytic domain-containing protein n=1 Tax=Manduca sexta TaxID=7130 RepID=A0A922CM71_MANSE|nr:hypothetical protein O3G_MSEX007506 [Manduca sexta]
MESAADIQPHAVAESESVPQCSATLKIEDVQGNGAQEAPETSAVQENQEAAESQETDGAQETQEPQEIPTDQEAPNAQEDSVVQENQAPETNNTSNKSFDRASLKEYRKTLSVGEWSPIENDSGVLTALLKELGVKGVRMEELWSVKERDFQNIRPVHGLIFLLKHPPLVATLPKLGYTDALDTFYFAKQAVNNACPTQAMLSIVMNIDHPDVELGEELKKLKNYSTIHEPLMRGIILGDATAIRNAHNAVAERGDAYLGDE